MRSNEPSKGVQSRCYTIHLNDCSGECGFRRAEFAAALDYLEHREEEPAEAKHWKATYLKYRKIAETYIEGLQARMETISEREALAVAGLIGIHNHDNRVTCDLCNLVPGSSYLQERMKWFEDGLKIFREHLNGVKDCRECKDWLASEPRPEREES